MGQLKKVQDMIENNEYCPNISIQLLAVISILKKANTKVLSKHLETCVREATETCEVEDKIEELEKIFELLERTY
ncbi:MAG: metal-sensing transcriptional repressor [Thermotogae bacterium]|nr:metal-sensing transcriptional repressor [Thermotogota bacterium]